VSLKPVWYDWEGSPDISEVYKLFDHENSFSMFPMLMRPKSRGRVALRRRNPKDKCQLYNKYLTEPNYVDIIMKGIKRAIELTNVTAFKRHGVELFKVPLPPCNDHEFASDVYWECSVRYITFTVYHQKGTCKMGPDSDENAVMDPQVRA
jgi:choline dehydrogenase